jgi:predicted esterase
MATVEFIHRFVPAADSSNRQRTLLLLHGTGGNESDLLPLGRALDPGAALLSPRGQVLENGMPRFFRRLAEGVFDEEDVVRRARELAEFVTAASDEHQIDLTKMTAVGYSNGANIAAAMLLLGIAPFRTAILLRAMVPLSPATPPQLAGVGVIICNGKHDVIMPMSNARQLASMLRAAGADVTLRFEEAGHELTSRDINAARDWLSQT